MPAFLIFIGLLSLTILMVSSLLTGISSALSSAPISQTVMLEQIRTALTVIAFFAGAATWHFVFDGPSKNETETPVSPNNKTEGGA